MTTNNKQKIKSPIGAYMGYLFQTFLKRPFGYIVAVLYIVYLAVILLIVPGALHYAPLFIWNIGGFNMPIFNLFFIAGAAASIAVAVFRTGRDDGFDLNMSAKPFTKGTTVWLKTLVYILIMLIINVITLIIVLLIYPIFGQYNETTNLTGITIAQYKGIIVSVFVGNLVNMLLFGGVSVFISMVGGQVITIIGTVGSVFLICLLNFLYPQVMKDATDVLSDKYDTEILSYSCNTLAQYKNKDEEAQPFKFAAIQCITDDLGKEEVHFDTKEYWEKAESEAGRKVANYIDIGRQLSNLYNISGLEESKLEEASKLIIGGSNNYNFHIDETTHVNNQENIENANYPICVYGKTNTQGKTYPTVKMVGGDMSMDIRSNWFLYSTLWQLDFNSISYISTKPDSINVPDSIWEVYKIPYKFMKNLYLTDAQKAAALNLYNKAYELSLEDNDKPFAQYCFEAIEADDSGAFFEEGKFDQLESKDKHNIVSKIHLYWSILAQQDQINDILTWAESTEEYKGASFPFTSEVVSHWYKERVDRLEAEFKHKNDFILHIYDDGIKVEHIDDTTIDSFSRLVTSTMGYAETYSNLYQYTVSNFYNQSAIIGIWTAISICLFAGAIIVYRKTDFK